MKAPAVVLVAAPCADTVEVALWRWSHARFRWWDRGRGVWDAVGEEARC